MFKEAMRLLEEGRAQAALQCADELVSSESEADRLSGYLSRGWVYEEGGPDLAIDLDRAIHNYLQVALIAPDWVSYANLARANLKKGGECGFANAFKYLQECSKIKLTPEILLGFAIYHREKPDRDLEKAKEFYLRAALKGRFTGLFGFSEVARELRQYFRAAVADCIRITLGPIVVLFIGSRARDTF